jgi:hypothetical protein
VARAGLGKPSQRVKEPDDSVEKVLRTKEISTSTSDLLPPVRAKGNGTATRSIRDKRRRVEWPGKVSPCKRGQVDKQPRENEESAWSRFRPKK